MRYLIILLLTGCTTNHIAPAYPEVDCLHGNYTGWRYRFRDDPIVHKDALWWGSHEVNRWGYWSKPFYITTGMDGRCIYA